MSARYRPPESAAPPGPPDYGIPDRAQTEKGNDT